MIVLCQNIKRKLDATERIACLPVKLFRLYLLEVPKFFVLKGIKNIYPV